MSLPTNDEIRAHNAAWDAEREKEFYADIPIGFEEAKAERAKWSAKPFTHHDWISMSFADQSYYIRGGRRDPNEWMPNKDSLAKMAEALSLTPSPSIISGYRVWAFDILDWLDRQGWKLVQK